MIEAIALAIAACPERGPRITCVVDGDTIWHEGAKLRLSGIDAPETDQARCQSERELGERAKARLTALMAGGYRVEYSGEVDRYRRPLVRVFVGEVDLGERLVGEGLARVYRGKREPWC